jgi:signal transduction histidine kinase
LQTAVQELTQLLEVQGSYGAIYASQEKTPTIGYEYSAGIIPESTDPQSIITFAEVYNQLQQTEGFQFCIGGQDTTAASTILVCPIVDDQEILGILCLFKPPQATFQDLQLRLVYQVAHQCAIALRQAQSYAAAQTQVAELGRLNQLKDDFLSTVSHELRTPVSNMKMAMQMLGIALNRESTLFYELTKPPTEQSKVARYFQILHNECEREISLINDLLDLQRLDSGGEALVLTTIRIQDWLPPLVAPFQAQAQKRQQSLEVQVADQLPALICDHASVGRVISELLNNACKYTPPEERIIVAARATTENIELSVTNFGVEIPPCEQKRIFDKFYRIPSADPWKQGGTGLGLALVQKLVSHLGGTIEVESGSSQTCFTVSLPIFPNG